MKISTFIEYLRKNNYSKNTLLTYQNVLNKYLDIFKNINGIKEKLLTEYKNPNTINTHFNVLSAYMKWSNDKRIKKLHKVKLPQIPKIYMKVFTKEYLLSKTKINKYDSDILKNKKRLIKFLFETGIRANELFNILEINKKTIKIIGKGNKIREIFHNYENTVKLSKFEYTTKTLRLWVKEILGNDYSPHSIRRSMATHLLTSGANPKMVMHQLGHEKIETTYRYLNLSLEENWKIYNAFL
jgi:integrase/recombinase XerD